MPELRQLDPDEWRVLKELAFAAFTDLEDRQGDPPREPPPEAVIERRFRYVIETDPGGAWLAEEDGRPVGAALGILREGLWGLSMLVVHPDAQSGGIGRALLERALRYGDGARGGIIASSGDARALRAYARAGFVLHPTAQATGVPRPLEVPPGVREGSLADLALTEAVDRAVRGAAHGSDIETLLADSRMFVVDGRGYALARSDHVAVLAATDERRRARPPACRPRHRPGRRGGPGRVHHGGAELGGGHHPRGRDGARGAQRAVPARRRRPLPPVPSQRRVSVGSLLLT